MRYKIISWNLNSIRVRKDHLNKLIDQENPEIIFLQETRVDNAKYPIINGYNNYYCGESGRNGVAILTKREAEILHLSDRKIIAKYDEFILINIYAPCQYGDEKIEFYKNLFADIKTYSNIILGGDFNVAHRPKDIHRTFRDLYNDEEREISKSMDISLKNISNEGDFTWWDYRMNGFTTNLGLAIDKFYISENLNFSQSQTLDYFRGLERPSDHAPICINKI